MTEYSSGASANKLPEWASMGGPPSGPPSLGSPADARVVWARAELKAILEERIFERIDRLLKADPLVAFIYMSCVIDYLAGFWHGDKNKTDWQDYEGFIEEYFSSNPDGSKRYSARGLYEDLRNGLVHNLTVGATYALTHGKPEQHLQRTSDGQTILNAESFWADLVQAKDNYFAALDRDPNQCVLAVKRAAKGIIDVVNVAIKIP